MAIGMVLLAVSCGQEPGTTGQAGAVEEDQAAAEQPGEGDDDEKVVDLPHLPVPNDEGVRMEAATAGTLRADPDTGCVWLELENGNPLALVWYDELRVRFPEDGPAQIEDREGTVYAVEGETVELGGGGCPRPPNGATWDGTSTSGPTSPRTGPSTRNAARRAPAAGKGERGR